MNLPVPPDIGFDRILLAAIWGLENITRASVPDVLLKHFGETGWSDLKTLTPYDYLQEPYETRAPSAMCEDYPRLYDGESGPTARALDAATTPSGAFFYCLTCGRLLQPNQMTILKTVLMKEWRSN
ncbi:unnamed protein product [Phytophthora fragariaefolia]|uniref:Unnamed protein product n=1 Tax=Phytophthora fragariaefolia TaxID=1490495 RepID=A0A9W6TXB5_9STRA|nr:unnamed protein product [Phytophthora fragariaefolia]